MFTSIFDDDFFTNFDALFKLPVYQTSSVFPPTTTFTTDEGMTFQFGLAGYSKSELEVSVEARSLIVKGNPEEKKDPENIKYYGTPRIKKAIFTIKKPIPDVLDASKIKVTFVDGLLTVFIPVMEKKEPEKKLIEIL